ncbi:DUF1450 domain-containing protein [Anaerobacillus isosaccharinicus]|uniref:DUF1450 domain-containing protein n=1 Tax=Anaerobacillus isosaccharinicus TaxID=1532552 RepID=A0A7S7RDH3_9BACI|nr:DUF1450 domain-containing protein [Anaerobacillus isosaccharinicus]MBA5588552.1 DUF1450 domain-containing protein [Anaerobacillus isosaccharinicus]QOY38032.1 DUF1450 domain-containing protein [Anaerobacillus isosaccharinicus]
MNRIECCFINRLNGCDDLFRQLEKQDDIKVETFNCIGNCLVCSDSFHCVVNGVRYVAKSEEELRQLIMNNLKR